MKYILLILLLIPSITFAKENAAVYVLNNILHINGGFDSGISVRVKKTLEENREVKSVILMSPGGSAYEGYMVGNLFSDRKLKAIIPKYSYCISACAIAFLGANEYIVDGVLAFHKAYILEEEQPKDVEAAYSQGENQGTTMAYWFTINGFTFELIQKIMFYTSKDRFLVFTHEKELAPYFMVERKYDDLYKQTTTKDKYVNGEELAALVTDNRLRILQSRGIFNKNAAIRIK